MRLKNYLSKRDLKVSKEPKSKIFKKKSGKLEFVIQKHAATRLHYDFRLEVEGVLKSWAIPKGPSLNPEDKRLAIMVEDHPFAYKDFEGIIPEGYGAGSVIIWDKGVYSVAGKGAKESEKLILEGLKKGELRFFLEGEKLKGEFALVKLKKESNEWLLIKMKDAFISKEGVTEKNLSVVSGKSLEELGGSKKTLHHLKPMLATLIDEPFDDAEWIFEIKMDGYRALAELNKGKVELYSRNLKAFNKDFPLIVQDLQNLKLNAILDGEIAAVDKKGVPHFQLLQKRKSGTQGNIYYYVFDILSLNGKDLRDLPLAQRKTLLKALIPEDSQIRYLDHVEGKGIAFLQSAEKNACEGIIGKKKQSPYQAGVRSRQWVKIKAYKRQEAVICGFTEPKGGRQNFGALILGVYKNGTLQFAGHVGGGFTEKKLQEIKQKLLPLVQKKCPFKTTPKVGKGVTWVKPKYLCEVRFSEWTEEGSMRQPIFMGLRTDKPAREAKQEKPLPTPKLLEKTSDKEYTFFTHLDKLYWPKEKITKGAVLGYYATIAPLLLPYLKERPQSLKRFPEGINGESFFQKNIESPPSWLTTLPFKHHDKTINYLLIQDVKSLLYAVNLGCIEIHSWLSRYQTFNYPEYLVFDLDPEDISFESVVEVALALHEVLDAIEVPNYCKTSGATGLHLCVPLKGKYSYEQAKQFCLIIASYVQQQLPSIVSLIRNPKKRQKKVYIDCMQNNLAQTIVAPYSLRAKQEAPVSTPLEWKEVKRGLDPNDFTFFTILDRIKKKGDIFKPLLQKGINMKKALTNFEKLLS